jgi:hypothetical protein
MTLDDFLDAATRRPMDDFGGNRGGFDCTLFVADWGGEICGRDPAADLRGTYSTRDEARAIIEKARGFIPLMAVRLIPLGWRSVNDPRTGDIGVVSISAKAAHVQMPAIHREGAWVFADPRRLVAGRFHPLMIWRFA